MNKRLAAVTAGLALVAGVIFWLVYQRRDDRPLTAALDAVTDDYRRIIVLVDGRESLEPAARAQAISAGRVLFWRKQAALDRLGQRMTEDRAVRQLVRYLTENSRLHDADKLAFLDLV